MSHRDPSSHIRKIDSVIRTAGVVAVVLILLAVGLLFSRKGDSTPTAKPPQEGEVHFYFLDVGQGDAALIRTSDGDILIDSGTNASEDHLAAYLELLGVQELAFAVFTHPDEDHIGGADRMVQRFHPRQVVMPNLTADSPDLDNLNAAIHTTSCEVIPAAPGTTLQIGGLVCTILAPLPESCGQAGCDGSLCGHINDHSIVLRADYGETSVLFVGDAESTAEDALLRRYGSAAGGLLDCDILKLGHHGSATSSKESFLKAVSPSFGIVSCGYGNAYGHPDQAVLARCERLQISIYRTDLDGSIRFVSTGKEPSRE